MQTPFNVPDYALTGATLPIISTDAYTSIARGNPLGNQGSYSTINLGGYYIAPMHNSYLDYAPYTKIELYVPYCGIVDLPPAMFIDSTVNITFIYDIFTGECGAAIFRNDTYYTYIGGNFTAMQALSSENVGAIKAAVINGTMATLGGFAATVGGVATGNLPIAAGGLAAMVKGGISTFTNLNSISPTMRGSSGGRCNFYLPNTCILYITTPHDVTDTAYNNHIGRSVMRGVTLSENMGYTVCDNAHISGDMTAQEKSEIENMLNSGVIL